MRNERRAKHIRTSTTLTIAALGDRRRIKPPQRFLVIQSIAANVELMRMELARSNQPSANVHAVNAQSLRNLLAMDRAAVADGTVRYVRLYK